MAWNCLFTNLDGEQRSVLDKLLDAKDSQWVRGFAGSGKSVILMHALGQLLAIKPNATACVIAFTHSLKDMLENGRTENSKHIPVMTFDRFIRGPFRCDYIFVDEVQDLKPEVLQSLKQHAGVLLLAGDEEQSIWEDRVSPDDIVRLASPQIHSLNVVYRLTEKLKKIVSNILPGSKVHAARNGRLQSNVSITLAQAESADLETEWVWTEAKRFTRIGEPTAILIPRHEMIQSFIVSVCRLNGITPPQIPDNQWGKPNYEVANQYFSQHGIELRYLGNGHGKLQDGEHQRIIYLMTYHSAKGLDFETVFLPRLEEGVQIGRDDAMTRKLFYVAATRSRRTLSISYSGNHSHPLLQALPSELLDKINIGPKGQTDEEPDDLNYIF